MIVVGRTVIHLVDGINRRRGQVVTRCGQVYALDDERIEPDGKFSEVWCDRHGLEMLGPCNHCRDRWPRRAPGRKRSAYRHYRPPTK